MAVIKRIFTSTLIAATFVAGATVTTPAMAQWGGWGGLDGVMAVVMAAGVVAAMATMAAL